MRITCIYARYFEHIRTPTPFPDSSRSILPSLPLSSSLPPPPFIFITNKIQFVLSTYCKCVGLSTGVWFTYQRLHTLLRNWVPPHQRTSIACSYWARCRARALILTYCWNINGLLLVRSCACNHTCSMFVNAAVLPSPDCFNRLLLSRLPRWPLSFAGMEWLCCSTLSLLSQLSVGMFYFLDENEQGDLGLESGSHIWVSKPLGKFVKIWISEPCFTPLLNFSFNKPRETSYNLHF